MPNPTEFPAKSPAQFNVVIVHGMQEYAGRYQAFAEYLAQQGGHIISFDLAGHGAEKAPNQLGDFGAAGLQATFSEIEQYFQRFNNQLPDILFGHSMGSAIALRYAQAHTHLSQLILCGLPTNSILALNAAYYAAKLEKFIRPQKPSLLSYLFKTYNMAFKPNRTEFDWLSVNPDNVNRYIADPLCGYTIAPDYFVQMFAMMRQTFPHSALKQLDPALKMLLIWGADDPVTKFGKGTEQFAAQLRSLDYQVNTQAYPVLRHEILHEHERLQVYQDIAEFIQTN
ncbi:alpha/beta fold hydrolase [Thiolinea disciformis]|uniref:alpha/beta fold hydrolase n=1 Tax=Thiolinea disciformis TaxID=125614 RepID=UPI00037C87F7|nr:alpha/beta fold hydrolase [Thiolinea disciformis]